MTDDIQEGIDCLGDVMRISSNIADRLDNLLSSHESQLAVLPNYLALTETEVAEVLGLPSGVSIGDFISDLKRKFTALSNLACQKANLARLDIDTSLFLASFGITVDSLIFGKEITGHNDNISINVIPDGHRCSYYNSAGYLYYDIKVTIRDGNLASTYHTYTSCYPDKFVTKLTNSIKEKIEYHNKKAINSSFYKATKAVASTARDILVETITDLHRTRSKFRYEVIHLYDIKTGKHLSSIKMPCYYTYFVREFDDKLKLLQEKLKTLQDSDTT